MFWLLSSSHSILGHVECGRWRQWTLPQYGAPTTTEEDHVLATIRERALDKTTRAAPAFVLSFHSPLAPPHTCYSKTCSYVIRHRYTTPTQLAHHALYDEL
jgi:hypothetical protein